MDANLTLPESRLILEARTLIEPLLPPAVLNHSLRSFLLGRAYGRVRRLDLDEEGLLLAALFHDLGLCPTYRDPRRAFQLNSSRALRRFLEAQQVPADRIPPLIDAIDFHMQLLPRWSKGNVAGLMQVGAWMDITFLRRWSIWRDAGAIARRYPRAGIDLQFPRLLLGSIGSVHSCLGLFAPGAYRADAPSSPGDSA